MKIKEISQTTDNKKYFERVHKVQLPTIFRNLFHHQIKSTHLKFKKLTDKQSANIWYTIIQSHKKLFPEENGNEILL